MSKKVVWQKIVQCFIIVFLLFNIVYAIVTNNKYTLSFMRACLFGVCPAIPAFLLLYTDKNK
nr:MAG TPA: hypothetical protein [Caudoviricetes sp.]